MWTLLSPVLLCVLPAFSLSLGRVAGGQTARGGPQAAAVVDRGREGIFPTATGDLEITWGDGEGPPSLMGVVRRYADLTGQRLVLGAEIRQLLEGAHTPLERPVTVPATQVQGFVEALIADKFVLSVGPGVGPRLLQVHSVLGPARGSLRSLARQIQSDQTALMRAHPAVWFTTLLEFSHVDTRVLSNSLRPIITDPNVMVVLPVGERSLIVCGQGPWVADLIEMLSAIDVDTQPRTPNIVHATLRLTHASALELAPTIELALAAALAQRESAREPARERRPTGATVQAYERLNALILTCTQAQLEEARELIAMLDIE